MILYFSFYDLNLCFLYLIDDMACELNIECLLHFIDKHNKPQIDACLVHRYQAGLHEGASGPKSCLVLLFVCHLVHHVLSHLGGWFLSSIKVGTKSLSIPDCFYPPYPNVVLGIENILNKYFPNDSLFSGLRQTWLK